MWGGNEKIRSVRSFCRDQGEGKKRGRGSAPSIRADILLQLVEQIPTLQPVENPTPEQMDIHWLNWNPRRSRGIVWGEGTVTDWLISPSTLHCSEQGGKVQDEEVNSSLGKGSEVGGSVVLICLWFSQSKSILTDSKLNFVQVQTVFPLIVFDKGFPCLCLALRVFLSYFLPPTPLRKRS